MRQAIAAFRSRPSWRRAFRRLGKDGSGVSAVEFALILPLMLTLYLGSIQISDAFTISRKVTHVASALGDLLTQSKNITDADMKNILDASASVLAPYSTGSLKMKVTGITIDNKGKATVAWSDARNDTPLTKGAPFTVPTALSQPSTFLVTTEVHYPYKPWIGYAITGSFDINDHFYLRPRLSDTVTRSAK